MLLLARANQEKHSILHRWIFESKAFGQKSGEDLFFKEMADYYEQYCVWGGVIAYGSFFGVLRVKKSLLFL